MPSLTYQQRHRRSTLCQRHSRRCLRIASGHSRVHILSRGNLSRPVQGWPGYDYQKKPGADTVDMSNYRPITNLNTTGKILERLTQKQLRRYIEQSPNVSSQQLAYRALHSTETVMMKVVNDLITTTDCQTPAVLLALDISVAFDTFDRNRLLERAKSYFGFDCDVSDRCSRISSAASSSPVNGQRSPTGSVVSGVP